jgi:hypothetical protein
MRTHNRATNLTYTKSLFHIFLNLFMHCALLAFGEELTHLEHSSPSSPPTPPPALNPHFCARTKELL